MKLLYKDLRKGIVKLVPETIDDLWLLSMVIEPGDLVKARTVREVKFGSRGSGRSSRVPMVLTVRVEAVEFQPFTSRLRIRGIVVEGPERFGVKGKRHTLSIGVGLELELTKPSGWSKAVLERIEASRLGVTVVVAAIDYDEYAVAVVRDQGVKYVVEDYLRLPGKDDPGREEALKEAIAVAAKSVVEVALRESADAVIVAGPGDLKNAVAERVRETRPELRVYVDQVSMGGRAGIEEALRRGLVRRIARDTSAVIAEEVVEKFEELVVKDPDMVAYGRDRLLEAAEAGAIEVLAVVDEALYSWDPGQREWVSKLLRAADETRARIVFVPSTVPAGRKISLLGGAIAILRYRLPSSEAQPG